LGRTAMRSSAHVYGSRVYRKNGMLYVTFGEENGTKQMLRAYDFKGRKFK
jgi:hypothetical protein